MQQEAAVHALDHLATRHEQGAAAPHEGAPCIECRLLASGGDGIPSAIHTADATFDRAAAAPAAFATRPVAAPACYSSRAPPAFS